MFPAKKSKHAFNIVAAYLFVLNWVFPQFKPLYLFTMNDKSSAKKLINIETQRLHTDFKMDIGEVPAFSMGKRKRFPTFLVLMTWETFLI